MWTDYSPNGLLEVHMDQISVMPISDVFDEILNPSIRLRVAGLLATLPDKEFTGREIAELLGVGHSNVQRAVRVLVDDGFALRKRIGNADIFRVNVSHFSFKAISELFRVKRGLSERITENLKSAFRDIGFSVTVFGSYARGAADRASDMDVLVIATNPTSVEDRVATLEADFARIYGVSLSVKVLSPPDLRRRPVPPYVRAAAQEGILISGSSLREVIANAG